MDDFLGRCLRRDGRIDIWETATGKPVPSFDTHRGRVDAVATAPAGRLVATLAEDQVLRVWELATGTERARLTGHHGGVYAVAFAPDGKTLATGGIDGRALPWNLAEWGGTAAAP